jgi:hypothetical protein
MVDPRVRLVHLVAGLVDELARDSLRRCQCGRAEGYNERSNSQSYKYVTHLSTSRKKTTKNL